VPALGPAATSARVTGAVANPRPDENRVRISVGIGLSVGDQAREHALNNRRCQQMNGGNFASIPRRGPVAVGLRDRGGPSLHDLVLVGGATRRGFTSG
jgi:hypothetical protein